MKRVVTIQDISCLGKCSLTVALPVLSCMGVETAVLPTAVLSTHTMFSGFTFRDLTNDMIPIEQHWKKEGIVFDAITTGYLSSIRQIELIHKIIQDFKTSQNLVIIDPAMGDHGKLYTGFDMDFVRHMGSLCGKADLILPNLTEACLITGLPWQGGVHADEAYYHQILTALARLGSRWQVLTGVSTLPGKTGIMGYDRQENTFFSYSHPLLSRSFHGTGDLFAGTVTGALMRGYALPEALKIAADFTSRCIQITIDHKKEDRFGVDFELALPELIDRLKDAPDNDPPASLPL